MRDERTPELQGMVDELVREGKQEDVSKLARITRVVSQSFSVKPDEVAIFSLTKDGTFLKFLLPEKLQPVGRIPVTSATALAARTFREKRAEAINQFFAVPHASVFEAVPLGDERGEAIQKIMSAPMIHEKKVVGVIQVCRKARNSVDAGQDFGSRDLKELASIANVLAPCIALCVPE